MEPEILLVFAEGIVNGTSNSVGGGRKCTGGAEGGGVQVGAMKYEWEIDCTEGM